MAKELEPLHRYACDTCGGIFKSFFKKEAMGKALDCEKQGTPKKHAFMIGDRVLSGGDSGKGKPGKVVSLRFSPINHLLRYYVRPDDLGPDLSLPAEDVYKIINGVLSQDS